MHQFVRTGILLVVITNAMCASVNKELPSYIKKCSLKNKTQLDKCLWENVEIVRPHLKNGIPEMRIPAVDPLFLPKVSMDMPNFHAAFLNATVNECTNFQLKSFELNVDANLLSLEMFFPFVRLLGDYELSGKLLVLQLAGHGHSSTNVSDMSATSMMRGHRETRNGKAYINFDNNTMKLKVGNAQLYFGNLFENNEELTATTNRLVNENIDEFLVEILPIIEETVGYFVFTVVQQVFKTFALDDLFDDFV